MLDRHSLNQFHPQDADGAPAARLTARSITSGAILWVAFWAHVGWVAAGVLLAFPLGRVIFAYAPDRTMRIEGVRGRATSPDERLVDIAAQLMMKVPAAIGIALVLTLLNPIAAISRAQSSAVVLSSADLGGPDDDVPQGFRSRSWLGLFIPETPPNASGPSRIERVRVRFVKSGEADGEFKIVTTPPDATLLVSGVRNIVPGPAVTAARYVDLWTEEPEARVQLGQRQYRIRLLSRDQTYCDAVISLTFEGVTQKLFDIRDLPPDRSCDDPHFRIHWAGDLDRDGRLDMLVTFSEKYSYFPRRLLLSSAAGGSDLVGEAARYDNYAR